MTRFIIDLLIKIMNFINNTTEINIINLLTDDELVILKEFIELLNKNSLVEEIEVLKPLISELPSKKEMKVIMAELDRKNLEELELLLM